jgi:hypothetical protein
MGPGKVFFVVGLGGFAAQSNNKRPLFPLSPAGVKS